MELELLKMIPGGSSVIATIIVVVLFLRRQVESEQATRLVTDNFAAEVRSLSKSFQDHINVLMLAVSANQKLYQDQIRGLIDDHMAVTRETITAVKGVEATVRELQLVVRQMSLDSREADLDRKAIGDSRPAAT